MCFWHARWGISHASQVMWVYVSYTLRELGSWLFMLDRIVLSLLKRCIFQEERLPAICLLAAPRQWPRFPIEIITRHGATELQLRRLQDSIATDCGTCQVFSRLIFPLRSSAYDSEQEVFGVCANWHDSVVLTRDVGREGGREGAFRIPAQSRCHQPGELTMKRADGAFNDSSSACNRSAAEVPSDRRDANAAAPWKTGGERERGEREGERE